MKLKNLEQLAKKVKRFEDYNEESAKTQGAKMGALRFKTGEPEETIKSRGLETDIGNWFYDKKIKIPKLESPYTYAKKILENPKEFLEIPVKEVSPEFLTKNQKPYYISYKPGGKTYFTREAFDTLEEAEKRATELLNS